MEKGKSRLSPSLLFVEERSTPCQIAASKRKERGRGEGDGSGRTALKNTPARSYGPFKRLSRTLYGMPGCRERKYKRAI